MLLEDPGVISGQNGQNTMLDGRQLAFLTRGVEAGEDGKVCRGGDCYGAPSPVHGRLGAWGQPADAGGY